MMCVGEYLGLGNANSSQNKCLGHVLNFYCLEVLQTSDYLKIQSL